MSDQMTAELARLEALRASRTGPKRSVAPPVEPRGRQLALLVDEPVEDEDEALRLENASEVKR